MAAEPEPAAHHAHASQISLADSNNGIRTNSMAVGGTTRLPIERVLPLVIDDGSRLVADPCTGGEQPVNHVDVLARPPSGSGPEALVIGADPPEPFTSDGEVPAGPHGP